MSLYGSVTLGELLIFWGWVMHAFDLKYHLWYLLSPFQLLIAISPLQHEIGFMIFFQKSDIVESRK